jgi:hypothetical protein
MGIILFLWEYLAWHYGKALSEIFDLFRTYLKFVYHFFSLSLMVRTWVSPLLRRREERPADLTDIEALAMALVGNLILRIVGFILRTFVLVIGIIAELCVIIFFAFFFVAWILLPVIIVLLLACAAQLFW